MGPMAQGTPQPSLTQGQRLVSSQPEALGGPLTLVRTSGCRKYHDGKNRRAQGAAPREWRFGRPSVSKTLAESSRAMGKAGDEAESVRAAEMKLLK